MHILYFATCENQAISLALASLNEPVILTSSVDPFNNHKTGSAEQLH